MRGSWWCSAFLLAAVISVSAADWSCVIQSDSVQEAWQSCPLQDEDRAGGSGARVRDSHQLSSSNGLGEEHNTEPKTNAAAASSGKIQIYQRQLRLEQQKCPNSALKCPSSASAAKKSNHWKQTKTGKQARNAQLQGLGHKLVKSRTECAGQETKSNQVSVEACAAKCASGFFAYGRKPRRCSGSTCACLCEKVGSQCKQISHAHYDLYQHKLSKKEKRKLRKEAEKQAHSAASEGAKDIQGRYTRAQLQAWINTNKYCQPGYASGAHTEDRPGGHRCWARNGYSAIGDNRNGWLWLVYSNAACTLRSTPKPPSVSKDSIWGTTKILVRCLKPTGNLSHHNSCVRNNDCNACSKFNFTEVRCENYTESEGMIMS